MPYSPIYMNARKRRSRARRRNARGWFIGGHRGSVKRWQGFSHPTTRYLRRPSAKRIRGRRKNPLYRSLRGRFTGRRGPGARLVRRRRRNPFTWAPASYLPNPRRKRNRSRGRRRNYSPIYMNPRRRRSRKGRKHYFRRRNPAIFGLSQLTKIPFIGPIFEEDVFYTGAGVALGVAFIPQIGKQIVNMTGLVNQTWYADPKSIGGTAVDVAMPLLVGTIGVQVASMVKNPIVNRIARGWSMAGVGIAVGTLLARWVFPMVEAQLPAQLQPGALPSTRPGAADYLQAGDVVGGAGVRDYLQAGDVPGMGDYLQAGDVVGGMADYLTSDEGGDADAAALVRQERSW